MPDTQIFFAACRGGSLGGAGARRLDEHNSASGGANAGLYLLHSRSREHTTAHTSVRYCVIQIPKSFSPPAARETRAPPSSSGERNKGVPPEFFSAKLIHLVHLYRTAYMQSMHMHSTSSTLYLWQLISGIWASCLSVSIED